MSNIKNPGAAVIIWNYKNRLTHKESSESEVHKVQETVLNTLSLISIQTSKSKSSPVGSFSFTLAPYKNWVDFITPGSWCAIMMTNEGMPQMNKFNKKAVQSELKFFGRITSVRGSVHVAEDGTRQTVFICEGEDWGSVFNSVLYVDGAARDPRDGAVGTAVAMVYNDMVKDVSEGKAKIPTTTRNIKALVNLWGKQSAFIANVLDVGASISGDSTAGLVINNNAVFKIPNEAANFLGISPSIATALLNEGGLVTGILDGYDKYKETEESVGIIDPQSVVGSHPIWSVMQDNTNNIINEMFCDLRWVDGKPKLGLYKRVRPFLISKSGFLDSFTGPLLNGLGAQQRNSISSHFKDIRRVTIPLEDVISFDAGTNWRDKLNFVEILPDSSQFRYNGKSFDLDTVSKTQAQVHDQAAFGREGLKAAQYTTRFYPVSTEGDPSFQDPSAWSEMVSEWYFNTHNLLNGTVEFVGQNEFIGVGDNIMIDSKVFGIKPNMNAKHLSSRSNQNFLLHVENVSHSFSVTPEGARHFSTTISFTRGVLANSKGVPTQQTAVDPDTSKLSPREERNDWNTVSTSSGPDGEADPDIQKVPKPRKEK